MSDKHEIHWDGSYRDFLREELQRRKSRNPHYSLSAFARQLGVGKATLSDVLAGKRDLSRANVNRVAMNLSLPQESRDRILHEIQRSRVERMVARFDQMKVQTN